MWLQLVSKGNSGRKRGKRNQGRGGNKDGGRTSRLLNIKIKTFFGFCSERTGGILGVLSRELIAKDLDVANNREG